MFITNWRRVVSNKWKKLKQLAPESCPGRSEFKLISWEKDDSFSLERWAISHFDRLVGFNQKEKKNITNHDLIRLYITCPIRYHLALQTIPKKKNIFGTPEVFVDAYCFNFFFSFCSLYPIAKNHFFKVRSVIPYEKKNCIWQSVWSFYCAVNHYSAKKLRSFLQFDSFFFSSSLWHFVLSMERKNIAMCCYQK